MYPVKHEGFFPNKCSNCTILLDTNEKLFTRLRDVGETTAEDFEDISNMEALSMIYGIDLDHLQERLNSYNKNSTAVKFEEHLDSAIPLVLCQHCASTMLELYRYHQAFLGCAHKDSFISEIAKDFGGHAFLTSEIKVEEEETFINSDIILEESEAMDYNLDENNPQYSNIEANEGEEVRFDPLCFGNTQIEIKAEPGFANNLEEAESEPRSISTVTITKSKRKSSKRRVRAGRPKNSKNCLVDDDTDNSDLDDTAGDADFEYTPNEQTDSDISEEDDYDNSDSDEYEPPAKQKKKSKSTAAAAPKTAWTNCSSSSGKTPRAILPKPLSIFQMPLLPLPLSNDRNGESESAAPTVPANFVILNPVSLIPQESAVVNSNSPQGDDCTASSSLTGDRMCQYCRKIFMNKQNLRRHLLTHAKVPVIAVDTPPYQCPRCPKGFSGMFNLREHCVRVHQIDVRKADKDIEIIEEEQDINYDKSPSAPGPSSRTSPNDANSISKNQPDSSNRKILPRSNTAITLPRLAGSASGNAGPFWRMSPVPSTKIQIPRRT